MTIEAPETPGARLRAARERMGLNQTELGRKLGVTGSYIFRIERDQVKIQPIVVRLAETLDVSVDYLLVLRDVPQRDATATALYESTQDELVALRLLRMMIDEVPPHERPRLIHFLIKQAGIYKETFRAQMRVAEPGSDG